MNIKLWSPFKMVLYQSQHCTHFVTFRMQYDSLTFLNIYIFRYTYIGLQYTQFCFNTPWTCYYNNSIIKLLEKLALLLDIEVQSYRNEKKQQIIGYKYILYKKWIVVLHSYFILCENILFIWRYLHLVVLGFCLKFTEVKSENIVGRPSH